VLHKVGNFRLRQFAEPNRIGEENRDDGTKFPKNYLGTLLAKTGEVANT